MKNTMKKIGLLFAVIIMTMLCAVSVSAEETTYTEGYFTYTVTDGEATIISVDEAVSGDVIIPETLGGYIVTSIGDSSFYGYNCEVLYIPKTVSYISGNFTNSAFYCNQIKKFVVDSGSSYFVSEDGVIYDKTKTKLIAYPGGNKDAGFIMPATVKTTHGCNGTAFINTMSFEKGSQFEEWECYFFYFGHIEKLIVPENVNPSTIYFGNPVSTKHVVFERGTELIEVEKIKLLSYATIDFPVNVISINEKAIPKSGTSSRVPVPTEKVIIRNPNCDIHDAADTIYEGATIYGYANSTAQAYADKYNRNFVALECEHASYEYKYVDADGCNNAYEYYECTTCGDIKDKKEIAASAKHSYETVITNPTCIKQGFTTYTCKCGDSYINNYVPVVDHKDDNGDYKCDYGCGYEFEKPAEPDTPEDTETPEPCSCNCHKGGIAGFFWKIANFFNKLFKIKSKQFCACGVAHF